MAVFGSIQSSAAAEITAIVATRTIYPGQMVAMDELASIALSHCDGCMPGYVVDQAAIVGKVAGKTILPNQLIYPDAVRSPKVIHRNADVTLVYRSGSLTISVAATPLGDAAAGESISVRSHLNNGVVAGIAQADGTVLAARP